MIHEIRSYPPGLNGMPEVLTLLLFDPQCHTISASGRVWGVLCPLVIRPFFPPLVEDFQIFHCQLPHLITGGYIVVDQPKKCVLVMVDPHKDMVSKVVHHGKS